MPRRCRHPRPAHAARAFTRADAAALSIGLALALAVLLAASPKTERLAGLSRDLAKLGWFGRAIEHYAADHQSLLPAFSWRAGDNLSQFPDLNNAPSDLQAHANQAIDILRRRSSPQWPDFPRVNAWLADISYSHLVLVDHLGLLTPDDRFIGASDPVIQGWADHYRRTGEAPPDAPHPRWAFASTFQWSVHLWSADAEIPRIGQLRQGNCDHFYFVPGNLPLGGRRLDEIAFPGSKVIISDRLMRAGPKAPLFFTHPQARTPVLLADGAARVRLSTAAHPGGYRLQTGQTLPATIPYCGYAPIGDPPWPNDGTNSNQPGRWRWTLDGLAGRDFDF